MNPTTGDIFLIPTLDGLYVPAQVIDFEKRTLHCISCGLFDQRVCDQEDAVSIILDEAKLFSTVLVFQTEFRAKRWKVFQNQKLKIPKKYYPYEKELKRNGIGVKILEPAMLSLFLNAFYGLGPWNFHFKPDYSDSLLIEPNKKPLNLVYKEE